MVFRIALGALFAAAVDGQNVTAGPPVDMDDFEKHGPLHWTYEKDINPTVGTCGADAVSTCGLDVWDKGVTVFGSKKGIETTECSGVNMDQSPIDAKFAEATPYPGSAPLTLERKACPIADFLVNSYTLAVKLPDVCRTSYVATFLGETYELGEYTFHSPSEHTRDGQFYPMEAHFVHRSIDETKYLVISVFMNVDSELTKAACPIDVTNGLTAECKRAMFFDKLLTMGENNTNVTAAQEAALTGRTDQRKYPVLDTVVGNDAYSGFIPPLGSFYHYMGSFTNPPCTPGVAWIISPTVVPIFSESLTAFRALINKRPDNILAEGPVPPFVPPIAAKWDTNKKNNNRPIQPMGSRPFYLITQGSVTTTNTMTAWDSSAHSSAGRSHASKSSMSSSRSAESDSFGSHRSSRSTQSGSSGFYMSLWKWLLLLGCLLCCCLSLLAAFCMHHPPKKRKQVSAREVPDRYVEDMPLLMPTAPLTTAVPMQEYVVPAMPSMASAPVMSGYPQVMSGAPGMYPGTVV